MDFENRATPPDTARDLPDNKSLLTAFKADIGAFRRLAATLHQRTRRKPPGDSPTSFAGTFQPRHTPASVQRRRAPSAMLRGRRDLPSREKDQESADGQRDPHDPTPRHPARQFCRRRLGLLSRQRLMADALAFGGRRLRCRCRRLRHRRIVGTEWLSRRAERLHWCLGLLPRQRLLADARSRGGRRLGRRCRGLRHRRIVGSEWLRHGAYSLRWAQGRATLDGGGALHLWGLSPSKATHWPCGICRRLTHRPQCRHFRL
jgi:hypothetical protein